MLADEPLDFSVTRLPFFLRPELPGMNKTLPGHDSDPDLGRTWELKESPGTWGQQMDRYTRKHPEKFGGENQAPDARVWGSVGKPPRWG